MWRPTAVSHRHVDCEGSSSTTVSTTQRCVTGPIANTWPAANHHHRCLLRPPVFHARPCPRLTTPEPADGGARGLRARPAKGPARIGQAHGSWGARFTMALASSECRPWTPPYLPAPLSKPQLTRGCQFCPLCACVPVCVCACPCRAVCPSVCVCVCVCVHVHVRVSM